MSQAATTLPLHIPSAGDLDPGEFLTQIRWRKSADRRIARSAGAGDLPSFATALRSNAGFSRKLRAGERSSESCDVFLQPLWSLKAFENTDRQDALVALLKLCAETGAKPDRKTVRRNSQRVLGELDAGAAAPDHPVVQLGWLTLLAWGSSLLDDEALVRLWLHALRTTLPWTEIDADDADPGLTDDQHLLVLGELPFLTGLVFQELRGSRRLIRQGARQLREGLEGGTDSDGTPHSRLLDRFSLWLSPFCRAAGAGRRFRTTWWDRSSAGRFSDLVSRSAALTRSSGEFALGNGVALAPASLLKAAARMAESDSPRQSRSFVQSVANDVAALTQTGHRGTRASRKNRVSPRLARLRPQRWREKRSDRPASQSDWARLACLRNNWGFGADACVIAYGDAIPRIDLTALGTTVVSGVWNVESSIDGTPLRGEAEWECVCWFTDRDVDYIELQRKEDQASVLRQAMLSRTDHFLYLADSVLSGSPGTSRVEHRFELPLMSGSSATRDALTREWLVRTGALRIRVLPVSIEQDATIAATGGLTISDDAVRLQQSAAGRGLVSSLVLDWSPARRKAAAAWSAVTVAEDGRGLRPDEASGVHLRIGDHQWLFYRSLLPGRTARTVLGQHTANETLFGELNSNGDLDPLILVEGTDVAGT